MIVEIIAIGDELLIGQTVNTNAAWMGSELTREGFIVAYSSIIQDEEQSIRTALDLALSRADLVLMTGGLGPTKDDITKQTLSDYFRTELEINEQVLARVKHYFESRNRIVLDVNVQQAALPKSARVLQNDLGTASGMWFDHEGKVIVSLPGVPYEMKHLMSDRVIPILKEEFEISGNVYRTLRTQGIGESYVAEKIKDIEDEIRADGLSFAYLPSPGQVRLRIGGENQKHINEKIEKYIQRVEARIPKYAFGYGEDTLTNVVGELLKKNGKTIGTVESCTGGLLAGELVSVAGSSAYYSGSLLTYSNEMKIHLANVSEESLKAHGAVSETVVSQMAAYGREKMNVDYCLATSGIAGPDGGTEEKPVGTVWIAVASAERTIAKRYIFGNDRGRNILQTVLMALNLLRREILGINDEKST